MDDDSYDEPERSRGLKIFLVGPCGVGKTSILRSLMREPFDEKHKPTFGLDFRIKDMKVDDFKVRMEIIDTYSDSDLAVDYSYYLENADIIMYIYDVTKDIGYKNRKENKVIEKTTKEMNFDEYYITFNKKNKNILPDPQGKKDAKKEINKDIKEKYIVLVGNKTDINPKYNEEQTEDIIERKVKYEEGVNLKDVYHYDLFFEVSAKDVKYIHRLFESTASKYFAKLDLENANKDKDDNGDGEKHKEKGGCILY